MHPTPKTCPSPFLTFPVQKRLRAGHDTPGADEVVGVTGEKGLTIGRPGEGDTLGLAGLLADGGVLGLELVDLALLLEIEDDDGAGGGGAEPVAVGGEDKGVDLVVGVERVEVLGLVQVPQHGGSVLATRGAERAVGGDGDGVDVASVADVVGLELAAREFPNLDKLVPARGDNDGVLGVRGEADAGHPLGVALVGDSVLAVTEGVPELDAAVTGAGDDLAVVGGEADGQNVVVVADEAASGGAGGELPETQSLVPRGRQSVGTVRRDNLSPRTLSACVHNLMVFYFLPVSRAVSDFYIGNPRTQSDTMWE